MGKYCHKNFLKNKRIFSHNLRSRAAFIAVNETTIDKKSIIIDLKKYV